jgi:hypothetical protein
VQPRTGEHTAGHDAGRVEPRDAADAISPGAFVTGISPRRADCCRAGQPVRGAAGIRRDADVAAWRADARERSAGRAVRRSPISAGVWRARRRSYVYRRAAR